MKEDNDPIQDYNALKKEKQEIQDELLSKHMENYSRYRIKRLKRELIGLGIATLILLPIAFITSYRDAKNREKMNEFSTIINNTTKYETKIPLNTIEEIQQDDLAIKKKEDSYYDNLRLDVGDLYNVHSKEGKIVVFCSVISGDEPKIGEVFHIESKTSSDLVYEATVYEVTHEVDSFGGEYLQVYFEGVTTEILAFTPEIRRVK